MATDNSTGSGGRKLIMIVVSVVLLIAAGAIYWVRSGDSGLEQLDSPDSATPYICLEDKQVFNVTPADFEKLINSGGIRRGGGRSDADGGVGVRILCQKCGKPTAVMASVCPTDKTAFPKLGPNSTIMPCPKCGWKPTQ